MAYTGRKPGAISGSAIYGEGAPLENHNNLTVDATGKIEQTAINGLDAALSAKPDATVAQADPTNTSNPGTVGKMWINELSGEVFVCTNATTNNNEWANIGEGVGGVTAPDASGITSNPASISFNQNTSGNSVTFTGAVDAEDGNPAVVDWAIINVSNSTYITSVTASGSVNNVSSATFLFNAGATAGADRTVTFDVQITDSSGITATKQFSLVVSNAVFMNATGGTITYDGDYKTHSYSSSSTFNVTTVGNSAGSNTVEVMVCAGGGGGGPYSFAGGGGGGGVIYDTSYTVSTGGNKTVTVGAGGAANGGTGNNSVFDTLTAIGGGKGGSWSAGGAGGSGGGGSAGNGTGGAGTAGQGYRGGSKLGGYNGSCGGGGASEQGADIANHYGSDGGEGRLLFGNVYGSGGGGGPWDAACGVRGFGGTNAANGVFCNQQALAAPAGYGGGGGGAGNGGGAVGPYSNNGGAGKVIIKYKYQQEI